MSNDNITIAKVADSVKVSPTTVSLVLNNRGRIRDSTRRRVREAAKTLGYRPRRALKASDREAARYRIAIVYPATLRHPDGSLALPQSLFLPGVHQELKAYDQSLSVIAGHDHVSHDPIFQHMLEADELDGVILLQVKPGDGYMDMLAEHKVPTVGIARLPGSLNTAYSAVSVDAHQLGGEVARFFANRGHKRLAVAGDERKGTISSQRVAGFLSGAREAGVEVVSELDVESVKLLGDPHHDEVYSQLAKRLLADRATALFTVMDFIGISFVNALDDLGVDVPKDVSVIGSDNIGNQRTKRGLRLSSADYDKQDIGKMAVRTLMQMMDPKSTVNHVIATLKSTIAEYDTTR